MGWSSYLGVVVTLAAVTPVFAQSPIGDAPPTVEAGTPPIAAPPAVGGVPMGGFGHPSANLTDANVERLRQQLFQLTRRRNSLLEEVQEALTKYGADHPAVQARQRELEVAEREMQRIQEELSDRIKALEDAKFAKSRVLLRPVAVELKNATVRQAAEALSKATQVPIEVTPDAPDDLRLTIQARGVSFGAVLQAIAKQANLKIAPGEMGIVLNSWPMVAVNGQFQVFKGAWAPWASEWGALPGYQTSEGWEFPGEAEPLRPVYVTELPPVGAPGGAVPLLPPGLSPRVPTPAIDPLTGGGSPTPGPPQGFGLPGSDFTRSSRSLTSSAAMAISLASLGDRTFAVSEPGRGPEGQLGAWITVYRIEGTQLKKIAAGFHALRGATPNQGGIPGTPGMSPLGIPGGTAPAAPAPGRPFGVPRAMPEGAPDPTVPGAAPAPAALPAKGVPSAPVTIRALPTKKATAPKAK